ncbi:MAG: HAMP domain-containing histidine kinase [Thermomicrobia bacterium]|nr:HAMP domain-containing histidine kinase [Thermomicrobia bacterium]
MYGQADRPGWYLARSGDLSRRALTQGANAMASGDYDRAMRLANVRSSNDEIGDLANAFQTMATNVARAQQAQRDLVANVSHELKTPLTSIQGFSQAMIDGTVTDDSEYQDLAQIIQQESQRMRRLVEQMLELSRLESGTVRLEVAPLRVDELVENVGKRYARLGEAKGVTVRWASPHNLVVNADAGRLEQVLVNLLDNALQYTDTGGEVTLSAQAARLNHVEFVLQDTGCGIAAEDVPRLFERFYQVERSRTGQGKHVGLGLAIVREIVDGHHGEITVQSTVGVGTTITISIPTTVSPTARVEMYRPPAGYTGDVRASVVG